MIETEKRKELFVIEVYNGTETNRVHHSLLQHLKALSNGEPSRMFGLDYGNRVLCVFESESCKIQTMKRLNDDERFQSAKEYFLFKSLEEIQKNVVEGWWLFDGEKVNLC